MVGGSLFIICQERVLPFFRALRVWISNIFSLFPSSFDLVSAAHCLFFLSPSFFLFVCLCFAQVASVLLQCLAALLLLGDPLGLEGCQHSVQPQPLQALWARREAKCSERVLRPPAQEDSGKPPGRGPGAGPAGVERSSCDLPALAYEPKAPLSKSARSHSRIPVLPGGGSLLPSQTVKCMSGLQLCAVP